MCGWRTARVLYICFVSHYPGKASGILSLIKPDVEFKNTTQLLIKMRFRNHQVWVKGVTPPPSVWSFVFLPKNLYLLVNWLLGVVVFWVEKFEFPWRIWSYTCCSLPGGSENKRICFHRRNFAHQHVNLLQASSSFIVFYFYFNDADGGWTALSSVRKL